MNNDVYLESLKPRVEGAMPVLHARRIDGIPCNHNLSDATFEGLVKRNRSGKEVWEVDDNRKIRINGTTGECVIPDTPFNRERLKLLSTERDVEAVTFDRDAEGNLVENKRMTKSTIMYEVVDETMKNKMAAGLMAKAVENISAEDLVNILAAKGLTVAPVQPAPAPEPEKTSPITVNQDTIKRVESGEPEEVEEKPQAKKKQRRKNTKDLMKAIST